MIFVAQITYRQADRSNPWLPILPGFRGEIVDGLSNGKMIYTGVCETREDCVAELITHLKDHGFHGKLRVAR